MSQSLAKIYLHIIFHARKDCYIHEQDLSNLQGYLSGILKQKESTAIKIGGTENHIHMLCTLPRTLSVSDFVRDIKASSSHWLSMQGGCYRNFKWQNGYGAFSVSQSQVEKTKEYIGNQKEHHRRRTWKEEYTAFLQLYGIAFDERYVFEEE